MNQGRLLSVTAVAAVLAALSGCVTTTSRGFKTSDVRPGEGVAIGRVRVRYNETPYTKECSICFSSNDPSSGYDATSDIHKQPCRKLEADGLVFQPLAWGTAKLERIQCGAAHHFIRDASFVVPDGVVYFGDVVVTWDWDDEDEERGLQVLTGVLLGSAVMAASEMRNDGQITLSLDDDDNPGGVIRAYREHIQDPAAKVYASLIELPDKRRRKAPPAVGTPRSEPPRSALRAVGDLVDKQQTSPSGADAGVRDVEPPGGDAGL
jgi:hypothetical protein